MDDWHGHGNLNHSTSGVFTRFALLIPAFSLLYAPAALSSHLHSKVLPLADMYRTLPYHSHDPEGSHKSAASEITLAPLYFRCRISWLVSFYALFKGWLPLSQPPSCLRNSTFFPTQVIFRVLIWRSGLFSFCTLKLSPQVLTAAMFLLVFGVWLDLVPFRAQNPTSALPLRIKLQR